MQGGRMKDSVILALTWHSRMGIDEKAASATLV